MKINVKVKIKKLNLLNKNFSLIINKKKVFVIPDLDNFILTINFNERVSLKEIFRILDVRRESFIKTSFFINDNFIFFENFLDFIYFFRKKLKLEYNIGHKNFFILNHYNDLYILNTKNFNLLELSDLTYRLGSNYRIFNIAIRLIKEDCQYYKFKNPVSLQAIKINIQKIKEIIDSIRKYRLQKIILRFNKKNSVLSLVKPEFYQHKSYYNDSKMINVAIKNDISPFGVVTSLEQLKPLFNWSKKFKMYIATASFPMKNIFPHKPLFAGAIDSTVKNSKIKAFIEAIERYSAGDFIDKRIKKIPYCELKEIIFNLTGSKPVINDGELIDCIEVKSIKYLSESKIIFKKEKFFLPLDLICYPTNTIKLKKVYQANSSGCAAGTTKKDSILRSFLELSERDSIVLTWINRFSLPIIKNDSLPIKLREIVKSIEKESNFKIFILDASLDKTFPNIIVAFFNKRERYPYFHMGAAASLSLYNAIKKALLECISSLGFIGDYYKSNNLDLLSVKYPRDHARFYHNPKNRFLIDFLRKGRLIDYINIKNKFKKIKSFNLLSSIGGQFFYCDISSFYSKRIGIFVSRVLSSELVPIWFGNKYLPLGKSRISKTMSMFNDYIFDKRNLNSDYIFLHPFG